ncbi:malto-oligosyltrehalose trehalohydrolase (MTHase) (4-alpha-D-((1-_4)-alpha-D-glucano)trehalose trehalohydrolase) [Stigmatella aurantiaca DW4/3-1]|uniref:Malto-oligosyltrehalose trehalohydrolase n=1 Tax=Stigmatella aurantiaca (strain DW4/3-1) TaxID=378806 RepID=Q098E3_STIAD|nr:malto-oligosyltrehalose trehalohydrolase (MTHase) (4-alpha-D-((1->4)-alpha-D-glucano)trehalose trehalohydrolase) [Stigmatella aurantiaca DW4/3-1]
MGALYKYRLDSGDVFPDPCSRFQPEGPHGPSRVVDFRRYPWKHTGWRGLSSMRGHVFYELHVGTFTPEGTYAAAAAKLPHLKELGITVVELMPLHTFPGRFNWGYDGVALFAPCAMYGEPDDLRRLVDEAHRLELGMLLDVVYNHLGPDGNYLAQFSKGYFNPKYPNEWGDPTNFDDGEAAGPSREFFIQNACHWVSEYRFDGLRLDATQSLYDASPKHIVTELVERTRKAAGSRNILLIAENEPQDARIVTSETQGGNGADGLWVDDFHHSARVAALGRSEAYLMDYQGTAQELLSCALRNSLYQGQYYRWQKKRRGSPLLRIPPERILFYLQNHDQLANTLRGQRLHMCAGQARARALTTLLLLLPQTPMVFMGQEFFASSPFLYFVDHKPELQKLVHKGRNAFLSQFSSARHAIEEEGHQVPIGEEAFQASKLNWAERERNREALALHQDLLRLRREDPVLAAQDPSRIAGAVLSPTALVLRYFGTGQEGDRLLLLNLGTGMDLEPCPEPLLAPMSGKIWRLLLSSEHVRYGGMGAPALPEAGRMHIPGQTALVLTGDEETKP